MIVRGIVEFRVRQQWRTIKRVSPNGMTKWGAKRLIFWGLDFSPGTRGWWVGLMVGGGTITLDRDDAGNNHPGWSEFTGYDGSVRAELIDWDHPEDPGAPPNTLWNAIASPTMTLTANAAGSIGGAFLTFDSAKGSTSGTEDIFATTKLVSPLAVSPGTLIDVTWTIQLFNSSLWTSPTSLQPLDTSTILS